MKEKKEKSKKSQKKIWDMERNTRVKLCPNGWRFKNWMTKGKKRERKRLRQNKKSNLLSLKTRPIRIFGKSAFFVCFQLEALLFSYIRNCCSSSERERREKARVKTSTAVALTFVLALLSPSSTHNNPELYSLCFHVFSLSSVNILV